MSDKLRVYISGPYTKGDPVEHTRNAVLAANEILDFKQVPIVPHLSLFWHFLTPRPWQDWLDYDLELLSRCDIILRLPGESTGADLEVKEAQRFGIPAVYSMEEAKKLINKMYCRGGY